MSFRCWCTMLPFRRMFEPINHAAKYATHDVWLCIYDPTPQMHPANKGCTRSLLRRYVPLSFKHNARVSGHCPVNNLFASTCNLTKECIVVRMETTGNGDSFRNSMLKVLFGRARLPSEHWLTRE